MRPEFTKILFFLANFGHLATKKNRDVPKDLNDLFKKFAQMSQTWKAKSCELVRGRFILLPQHWGNF
jgi:hypothetical protein